LAEESERRFSILGFDQPFDGAAVRLDCLIAEGVHSKYRLRRREGFRLTSDAGSGLLQRVLVHVSMALWAVVLSSHWTVFENQLFHLIADRQQFEYANPSA